MFQEFIHTGVGFIAFIYKIDHHHIVFLPVTVAAADALFDALRVPQQIVVDDKRAKLQVDAFCARFGGNHEGGLLFEIFHQRGAGIRRFWSR